MPGDSGQIDKARRLIDFSWSGVRLADGSAHVGRWDYQWLISVCNITSLRRKKPGVHGGSK